MTVKEEPRIYKTYEVLRQPIPSSLFPEEPVSKRKTFFCRYHTEEEARKWLGVEDELCGCRYLVRERVWRWVRKNGFAKNKHTGELFAINNIEVLETISLKNLGG